MMRTLKAIHNCQFCIFYILIFISSLCKGQESEKSIQLLDEQSHLPITGATFQYSSQSGISNAEGIIKFQYISGETIFLSHISYGQFSISGSEVKSALLKGVLYIKRQFILVQPITIIAVHQNQSETEILSIDNQDRLAHDGGAILNQTPAIASIRKSGNYGFDPVFRGFKYDQLNLVINGAQCASAACPNRMDPPSSQIAPNMMKRIEILKGPYSLRYGTSFGGTINFVSADPDFSEKNKTYGRLSGNYDSNGNIFRSEGLIGLKGAVYDIGLFGSWSQGNDYKDGDDVIIPAEFSRASFGTNMGFKLNDSQHLILNVTRNFSRDADFPSLPMDLRKDDTWLLNAQHKAYFNGQELQTWNTSIYGTFVDHLMDNYQKSLDPRIVDAETKASTFNFGGRTEGIFQFTSSSLYAGIDFRFEKADGHRKREFLMGPNAGKSVLDNIWQDGQISRSAVFTEYHLETSPFRLVFAGRLEINKAEALDPDSEFSTLYPDTKTLHVNPSLSFGATTHIFQKFSFGLWLGRAKRSGSLSERFINFIPVGVDPYEMVGNPNLNPEVNNQVDISMGYKSKGTVINITLFASFLQDFISSSINDTLSPKMPGSPGVRQYVNIDDAFMTGFELSWNQNLFIGLQHSLTAAYTYAQDKVRNEPLPEIPPLDFRYNLFGTYLKNKLKPGVSIRHVFMQNRISPSFGETTTPNFTILNINISYQITRALAASFSIHNLFDVSYYEHLNRSVRGDQPRPIYAPGRSFVFSLVLDLT